MSNFPLPRFFFFPPSPSFFTLPSVHRTWTGAGCHKAQTGTTVRRAQKKRSHHDVSIQRIAFGGASPRRSKELAALWRNWVIDSRRNFKLPHVVSSYGPIPTLCIPCAAFPFLPLPPLFPLIGFAASALIGKRAVIPACAIKIYAAELMRG